jgi:hypothetical protein
LHRGLDQPVGLAEQREQQVLGVELVMAKAEQQLLDTNQSLSRLFSELF